MSVWLNLVPQLHKTGLSSAALMSPPHNSLISTLEGPAWGVVRNVSNVQATIDKDASGQLGLSAAGTTCMTLAESQRVLYQHNDTLTRLEKASKHAYSYAMGITAGLGGVLCLLNAILFVCICHRRKRFVRIVQCGRYGLCSPTHFTQAKEVCLVHVVGKRHSRRQQNGICGLFPNEVTLLRA